MHVEIGSLVVDMKTGEGARKFSWRSLVKSTLKQGILLSRKLQTATTAVRREAEQLVQEARAELDRPATPADASPKL